MRDNGVSIKVSCKLLNQKERKLLEIEKGKSYKIKCLWLQANGFVAAHMESTTNCNADNHADNKALSISKSVYQC